MRGLPLARGQVYKIEIEADDQKLPRGTKIVKYAVVLQNHHTDFQWKLRASYVLTTSHCEYAGLAWNVLVPVGSFAAWPVDTMVQCADVYSMLVADFQNCEYLGLLSDSVMVEIGEALEVSLGLV